MAQQPRDVLDVGCGRGAILAGLRDCRVPAIGVEPGARDAAAARDLGLTVWRAPAADLPFTDRRFDWVVMRHVPHHLPDPAAGLREAWRVARRGVVVAEPWFDRTLAHQRVGDDFEEWAKRFDRRNGRVHQPRLEAADLLDVLGRLTADLEVHRWLIPVCAPLEDLVVEGAAVLASASPTPAAERHQLAQLVERARRDGWSRNGSLAVVARRR